MTRTAGRAAGGAAVRPAKSAAGGAPGGAAGTPPSPAVQRSLPHSSLAVASLDIGRVLADRDGMTFRAQGTCMYPTIRPGDVLRIRSCRVADVAVGDIAVCRTPAYLYGHRVIEAGERDGRAYIVTRPDRSVGGGDKPTFEEDLLGVVRSIERDGASVPLQPPAYPWAVRTYHGARLALVEAVPRGRARVATVLASVQEGEPYRRVARRLFAPERSDLSFAVRVPLNATLGDAVYRELEPGAFDPDAAPGPGSSPNPHATGEPGVTSGPGASPHGRPVDRWTLTVRVHGVGAPAAWVTFARGRDGAWRVEESYVRVRYRGTGVDDALMRRAEGIVRGPVEQGRGE